VLRQAPNVDVVGLVTTLNERFDRVAMHATRRELVEAQARRTELPLTPVWLPWPCPNDAYEQAMRSMLAEARARGITHMAFGDLYLEDIRSYRIALLDGSGIEPLFPLWRAPHETPALAREMIDSGLRAVLTCVDPRQCDPRFVGRTYDYELLRELPETVDPCGERGEFHTFCTHAPVLAAPLDVRVGEIVERDGFWFADVISEHREPNPDPGSESWRNAISAGTTTTRHSR
jgi:diphthamide synthase (EF-2-diphthine--ammonia ligase)